MAQALPTCASAACPISMGLTISIWNFDPGRLIRAHVHMSLAAARGTESNLQDRFQLPGQVVRVKGPG